MKKNSHRLRLFTASVAIVLGFGCGIKGPPLPPLDTIEPELQQANSAALEEATDASLKTTPVKPNNKKTGP